ncbi:DUF2950 family protein [Paraburkholderia graminis]|uniref:DUF2950 family protein n=1 Tax=Paraburkholderia graminis TaxID=60548 RepID=UPI0038BD1350
MGGAQNHKRNDVLDRRCILVAWPVIYGTTGVAALLVDQDGQLSQQGLGPQIARIVSRRESFRLDGLVVRSEALRCLFAASVVARSDRCSKL